MISRHLGGVLLAALSAAAFGLIPIFARYAYAGGANLVTLLLFRFACGAAAFWGYHWIRRLPVRVGRGDLWRLLAMGVAGYAVMSSFYYSSVRFIPVALAALLLYVYPALVTVLAWRLLREPVGRGTALALLAALAGTVLVLGPSGGFSYNPIGIALALGAALFYSAYITAGGDLSRRVDPLLMSTYITTAATAVFAGALLAGVPLTLRLTAGAWAALIGNAVVATVIAIPAFFAGVARIGSAGASIISTLEPLVSIAASALLLAERLTLWQGIGAALVVGSGILIAAGSRRPPADAGRESAAP